MFHKKTGGTISGFTLLELMIVVAVLAIVIAIAIPGLMNSKKRANEASAIASLKNMGLAQTQYRVRFGSFGTLANLTATDLMDSSFTDSEKSGYLFAPSGVVNRSRWAVTAEPITPGASGDRYFYADHTGVVRFKDGSPAGATDPAVD